MISDFSVKKPYTVLVGVVLAIILGVVSFTRMTADLLPNISLPYVIVMTTYPGASPETVEAAVTQPVEAAMATVSNIESVSSVSNENYSMVILEFAQTADMNAVSLEIRESLDQIKSYWNDSIGNPIIMKLNPDMLPVMIAAVGVEGMDYAQISTYAQESIMPELESIEGVASVSATGLLEESVNVIIRQEKVDAVNEKIFAAIDDKMQEARNELEDGREALEEGRQELADGRKELDDGKKEIADGKAELEDGKQELNNKKSETAETLANTKKDLLTAKADLEAAKINFTTNLTTARELNEGIARINALTDILVNAPEQYLRLCQAVLSGTADGNVEAVEQAKWQIQEFKAAYLGSEIIQQMKGVDSGLDELLLGLEGMDWSDSNQFVSVTAVLTLMSQSGANQIIAQRESLENALNSLTNGLGLDAYTNIAEEAIRTMDEQLAMVDAGLVEVEKGQLEAALGFAEANSQIALGEYQMKLAESQLDSALEQIEKGEEQLKEAEEQIEDGLKQLEEAKESAYEQADMTGILTVETVNGLLTAQNFSMPAGYVTEEGISYMVRVGDKPSTVEELQALPLMDMHMDNVPVITLQDVADVFYTDNSSSIYTNVDGSAGVMLTIQKQTGYSTGEVSDLLGVRFGELMEADSALSLVTLMDQGIYIDLVMDSILNNILFGAVLAIIILLVFLKDVRPTLVVAFSIPISLVTAIVCMYFSGVTLNIISLSGLALGIGMLVDNSIVVIENIYRLRGEGYSVKEAAMSGAGEVAGAILASTLTTVCVFLPIVFTEGVTRQLFVDMGLTIAYSLLASLVIALTVVPAMSSKMLVKTKGQKESKFFGILIKGYGKLLSGALKVKPLVLVLVLILLVGSVLLALTNGTAFMADMDSTQLTVSITLKEDATLEETGALTDQVVEAILSIEDVQNVGAMTNSSTMSLMGGVGGGGSTNATTVYVVTKEEKTMSNEEIAKLILDKTQGLEAEITIDTSSMDMSAMGGSGISIQVRGRDLDTLRRIAADVALIIESVEGTVDVSDGLEEADEELRISIRREEAVHYGLTVAQVFSQIYGKLASANVATTLEAADKDFSVYVMNGNDITLTRELVKTLEIDGTNQEGEKVKVPLLEIASFEETEALSSISRVDQTRYVSVSAGIAEEYNIGLVAADVDAKLANYKLPAGYRLVSSGENEMITDAMEQIELMLVLAILFMYLIMVAQFQSLLSPFIIMFTIPLAFTGGFFGLYISGSEVSVIAMIGFVMLAGVIVNNGIVLIDYMNQLRQGGMEKRQAILTAGKTRLRPVLMTALTTILALCTMVFSDDMGSEMAKPMAVVTIGGLTYGTLLTLVVIPCIYDLFSREKKRRQEEVVSQE